MHTGKVCDEQDSIHTWQETGHQSNRAHATNQDELGGILVIK